MTTDAETLLRSLITRLRKQRDTAEAERDEARAARDGWKVAYENLHELSSARMAALEGLLRGEVTLLESWAATSARSGSAATMEGRAQQIRAALTPQE